MGNYKSCIRKNIEIYYELKNNKKIKDLILDEKITFKSHHIESWCFQLKFKNKNYEKIGGISISVPPDAIGNRGNEYNEPEEPTTLETALVDSDGELIYIDELGYDDVKRFYYFNDIELLVNEIKELIT
jgi:hypothetical protein